MAKIYMVRHGQASAGWDADLDPGLSPLGHKQAAQTAKMLEPIGPVQVFTSPMARARETARPLCGLWQVKALVEPRVAEIPSPALDFTRRRKWLDQVMQDRWSNLDADLQDWRTMIIDAVGEITEDAVIFSHFIAINVVAGVAENSDHVVNFFPDNASVTKFEVHRKKISLLEKGKEAGTQIR